MACEPAAPTPCTAVGALLPFTGEQSSVATSVERALLLGAELVSAAGGVDGKPVCVVSRDSGDSLKTGTQAAAELLQFSAVEALFGPQDDELALRVLQQVRERQVIGLSGGTTSPALTYADDGGLWFRTTPSAAVLGRALAERIFADGVRSISVLYESSEAGVGWANVLQSQFTVMGGRSLGIHSYLPGQRTYAEVLAGAFAPGVEAVVLVASAVSGAAIVEEWATRGLARRWYFASSLEDPQFVDNVPPGSVDGMVGVAPALGTGAARLDAQFGERWLGERPLRTATFYYDALLLWALAREDARARVGAEPRARDVAESLHRVSAPPGQQVSLDALDSAMDLAREGADIDYVGATGDADLDERGEVAHAGAQFWHVDQGRIVFE